MEDRIGSLETGKYADLVLWDTNLYTAPTAKLKEMKAQMTMLNGEVVYGSVGSNWENMGRHL